MLSLHKFSIVIFSKCHRLLRKEMNLIGGLKIPLKEEMKYLGMYLDRKLLWTKRMKFALRNELNKKEEAIMEDLQSELKIMESDVHICGKRPLSIDIFSQSRKLYNNLSTVKFY